VAVSALGWLATAELLRDRPEQAVGAARRALALSPTSPVAVYALAQGLQRLGDPAALGWLKRARQIR
jgi:predicted Zn-dependent protease